MLETKESMKENSEKEIYKENGKMNFYSLYFRYLKYKLENTIYKCLGNPYLHVISLFKTASIYFTKMTNITFIN